MHGGGHGGGMQAAATADMACTAAMVAAFTSGFGIIITRIGTFAITARSGTRFARSVYSAYAPRIVSPGPCTCLSKEYTPEGAVLFKDRCTNEAAMNPPAPAPQQTGALEPQVQQYSQQYCAAAAAGEVSFASVA